MVLIYKDMRAFENYKTMKIWKNKTYIKRLLLNQKMWEKAQLPVQKKIE